MIRKTRCRQEGKAKRQKLPIPKCSINCNHSNCKAFSWIEAKALNQVSGDSTEGWEVRYFDASLDDRGLDRAGYYREEWVNCKERKGDNFTTPKAKPLGPGMKQHLRRLEEEKQKKSEVVQARNSEEVKQETEQDKFMQAILDESINKTWWKSKKSSSPT